MAGGAVCEWHGRDCYVRVFDWHVTALGMEWHGLQCVGVCIVCHCFVNGMAGVDKCEWHGRDCYV